MSVDLIKLEIGKFLESSEPEVLCIRGKWGVGKTFTWDKKLEASQAENAIKLRRYSYVSLFGVNSLDELKFAIFENVITISTGNRKASLETLDSFINSNIGSWRKVTRIAQSVPILRNVVSGDATSLVSFMTIRDQIICIDDIERRGKNLDVKDVLGLISYLKEQRNCKIVLILNDEQFEGEDKNKFEKNLEKVMDVSLTYRPTPSESAAIGIKIADETNKQISECCIALGITNIRVIKRICRTVQAIKPLLKEYDPDVLKTALKSIVLFSWSHDQPEEAPPMEYFTSRTKENFALARSRNLPPKESAWNALLEEYGYIWTDKFDLELIQGVSDGYFVPDRIKARAQELHIEIIGTKADGSFEAAWTLYHDSFADNQDEALKMIHDSFMKNVQFITPTNLNGTVTLFKDLGKSEQALAMLKYYMSSRSEERAFYNLEESPFGRFVTDPDVREAFAQRVETAEERRDMSELLMSLKNELNDDVIAALSTAPVESYRAAFKAAKGADLRRMLSGALQFDRILNASDAMREISNRAREALRLIGAESAINALRVRRFGVAVEKNK